MRDDSNIQRPPIVAASERTRLYTSWTTVLFVDETTGELRHGSIENSPTNVWFVADATENGPISGWLAYEASSTCRPIICYNDHSQVVPCGTVESGETELASLEVVPLERGLIALRSDNLYLCAQWDGRVTLGNSWCSTWECFVASEDWCSSPRAADGGLKSNVDWRRISEYIIEPLLRAQSRHTAATKVVIFGHTQWSHGRVYYDVCKALSGRGYVIDLLDWTVGQGWKIERLLQYYDFFLSALDGIVTLMDIYLVPAERIIGLSHHEMDIQILIAQKGKEIFNSLAGYGVVSYQLYDASAIFGVTRHPLVVQLGVNTAEFAAELPERLTRVGYAGSLSHKTLDGIEWKRGDLAEAVSRDAGLELVRPGAPNPISFHDMPSFYRSVDAVLVTSLTEGAQLPIREAAAAGRLVISTPVGDFPLRAAQGCGIIAPIERHKYRKFVSDTLVYYKDNPRDFVEMCGRIRTAAQRLDWLHVIDDWIELIETAGA